MPFFDDSEKKRSRKRKPPRKRKRDTSVQQKFKPAKRTKSELIHEKEPPVTVIKLKSVYKESPPRTREQLLVWEPNLGYSILPAHVVLDHILDDAASLGEVRITHWANLEDY